MHTPSITTSTDAHDIADQDFGRAVTLGAALGVPAIYVLTVLLALAGGAGLGFALGVAVLPAIVGGPYAGGLMVMARIASRHDHSARVLTLPTHRPAAHAERAA